MLNKVRQTIKQYNMLNYGNSVLVGLSGGADSVALLLALIDLKDEYGINISALHVNHNLRGSESKRDEEFCRQLCYKLSVPLVVESIDVISACASTKESTELAARKLRYESFYNHSKGKIATAHNANDNLETVIYNLCRGTGINGLCGVPPKRDNIIRPLIKCTRDDILKYLDEKHQDYVVDSTNNTNDYTRNRIRHNVIPELLKINPCAVESVARNCDNIRCDADFINKYSDEIFIKHCNHNSLSEDISNLPTSILSRVLINYYKKTFGAAPDNVHITNMELVAKKMLKRTSVEKDYLFEHINKKFVFEKIPEEKGFTIKITNDIVSGLQNCGYFDDVRLINSKDFKKVHKKLFKFSIDCDKIIGDLTVRNRKNGDKYRPVGRNVTKSVGKLLTEYKCSLRDRASIKVINDENGIIFTSLFGIDERVKADDNSKNIIVIGNGEEIIC